MLDSKDTKSGYSKSQSRRYIFLLMSGIEGRFQTIHTSHE